jgi:hypothetical protein
MGLYQGAKPGLHVRQAGGHQSAVTVVQLAALSCGGGALGPAPDQCPFGITPTDERLEALEVQRMTHVAAESTAFLVNAENPRDASLPFTSSPFQGYNVVSLEITVLAIEKHRELVQRPVLFADETGESFAAL